MNRENYAGGSGIIIDVCKSDGIWLERDEMRQIVEFIRSGGLRKLEKENAERKKEEEADAEIQNLNIDSGGQSMDSAAWLATPDGSRTFSNLINSLARHLL